MQPKLHISIVIKQVSFVEILVTNTLITRIIIITSTRSSEDVHYIIVVIVISQCSFLQDMEK